MLFPSGSGLWFRSEQIIRYSLARVGPISQITLLDGNLRVIRIRATRILIERCAVPGSLAPASRDSRRED